MATYRRGELLGEPVPVAPARRARFSGHAFEAVLTIGCRGCRVADGPCRCVPVNASHTLMDP